VTTVGVQGRGATGALRAKTPNPVLTLSAVGEVERQHDSVAAYIERELGAIDFLHRLGRHNLAALTEDRLYDFVLGGPAITESERRLMDGNR
jgi:hypothetical protein